MRGIVVVLTLLFWFPVALYGAAWLLLPDVRTNKIELEELFAGRLSGAQLAAGIILFIGIFNPGGYVILSWIPWYGIFVILAMIACAFMLFQSSQNQQQAGSPAGPTPFPRPFPKEDSPMSTPGPNGANQPPNPYDPQGQRTPPPPAYPQNPAPNRPGAWQQPAPHYYAPPVPPVQPVPPNRPLPQQAPPQAVKPMSSVAGLLVLGGLSLVGALFLLIALTTGTQSHTLAAVGAMIALIAMALTLGIAALRGHRGGWFLGISIVAALVLFPIGMSTANTARYVSYGYDEYEYMYNGTPWDGYFPFGSANDPFSEDQYEEGDETISSGIRTFDHTNSNIYASSSMATLDLTGAPADYWNDISLTADSSMVTILIREDQALNIVAEGHSANLRMRKHHSAELGWFPDRMKGEFNQEAHSPNYIANKNGIKLNLILNSSNASIVVSDVDAPAPAPEVTPEVTPVPTPPTPTPEAEKPQSGATQAPAPSPSASSTDSAAGYGSNTAAMSHHRTTHTQLALAQNGMNNND